MEQRQFAYWDVTFDGNTPGVADDFTLHFVDCSNIVGEPLLKNMFLDDLIGFMKNKGVTHYTINGNIKHILDDNGEDQSDKNIYALLGILKNGLRVGFLLGNIIEDGEDFWHVAAVWPEEFARSVLDDQKSFHNALFLFIDDPGAWLRVDLIVPIEKNTQHFRVI